MRWDDRITAMLTVYEARTDVQTLLGAPGPAMRLYQAGQRELARDGSDNPLASVEWSLIGDSNTAEIWNAILVQIDIIAPVMTEVVTLENAAREEFDRDYPIPIGSETHWVEYLGSRPLAHEDDQMFTRSLDFRITAVRKRYT